MYPSLVYDWSRRGLCSRPLTHDWCKCSSIISLNFISLMNTACMVYALGFKDTTYSSLYVNFVAKVPLTNLTDSGHTA